MRHQLLPTSRNASSIVAAIYIGYIESPLPNNAPTSATLYSGLGILFCSRYKEEGEELRRRKTRTKAASRMGVLEISQQPLGSVCLTIASPQRHILQQDVRIYVCEQQSRQRGVQVVGDALLHRINVALQQRRWRPPHRHTPRKPFSSIEWPSKCFSVTAQAPSNRRLSDYGGWRLHSSSTFFRPFRPCFLGY